jgi:hypothetical protein
MLHSRPELSAIWNNLKLAAAAAAMAVLAGCAVAVPLRPLPTALQGSGDRDFACTANSQCPKRTSRRSELVSRGNIAEDPPDFILNDQAGMLR